MTRDEAKQLLPIIQAYSEGKEIQALHCGEWMDLPVPIFFERPDRYRIKPDCGWDNCRKEGRCRGHEQAEPSAKAESTN